MRKGHACGVGEEVLGGPYGYFRGFVAVVLGDKDIRSSFTEPQVSLTFMIRMHIQLILPLDDPPSPALKRRSSLPIRSLRIVEE
jgi:hypothetical protein